MSGGSLFVRALWPATVVALSLYLLVAMTSHPPVGSAPGVAAVPPPLTVWVSSTDADAASAVAEQTARGLGRGDDDVRATSLPGGSTAALDAFFGGALRTHAGALVVTSTTLSDLAREREDADVPGAAQQAAIAQRRLAGAVPLALLADDPLEIAVPRRSGLRSADALLRGIRRAPAARRFAIDDDTFSRGNLAALVRAAQSLDARAPAGEVPFQIYGSAGDALAAMAGGHADAVLAPRSAVRAARGHVAPWRGLAWPAAAGPAPQSWIALVARPDLPADRIAELRDEVAALTRAPAWRAGLRAQGRTPAAVPAARLGPFLAAAGRRAAALQRLVADVERS